MNVDLSVNGALLGLMILKGVEGASSKFTSGLDVNNEDTICEGRGLLVDLACRSGSEGPGSCRWKDTDWRGFFAGIGLSSSSME